MYGTHLGADEFVGRPVLVICVFGEPASLLLADEFVGRPTIPQVRTRGPPHPSFIEAAGGAVVRASQYKCR